MIIKVCGMRDPENIREVAVLGIDWIGLIFFAGSPRRIIDNGQSTIICRSLLIAHCQLPIVMKHDWKPGTMIYPLPAVLASCAKDEREYNIITVAWTGTLCTHPPMC